MYNSKITLDGTNYQGKLDFYTFSKVQNSLKKNWDEDLTFPEIIQGAMEMNMPIMFEIACHSIIRSHPLVERDYIIEQLGLGEFKKVIDFVFELLGESSPK